jgi:2-oxoglutarate/2-oxoacid ferredoxin oxidoreductase subunit alpha
MSFVIRIGGGAGQGMASAADILSKLVMEIGYHVYSSKDYASQIRGGHNYHNIRCSKLPVFADIDEIDFLLAFDQLTLKQHSDKITSKGTIILDDKIPNEEIEILKSKNKNHLIVPLKEIEEKLGQKNIHNAIFLGVIVKNLGLDFTILENTIKDYFTKKPKLAEKLILAAKEGFDFAKEIMKIPVFPKLLNKKFLNGNDAICAGALKANLTFLAQYPMTPASSILHTLAKEAITNENLMVIQPEDEIAAINFALGASSVGRRAMTATSGGGFALMVESLGLSSMAEVPLVIVEGQRPGPATGLPTKNGQGDLKFVLSAAPGDFPKVVIAPGNVEDCYTETKRAFYLAEKYQLPAIILTDKQICESFQTVDLQKIENDFVFEYDKRINIIDKIDKRKNENSGDDNVDNNCLNQDGLYKRYAPGNLICPLVGTENGIFTFAGDEHDEVGYITEDPKIAKVMNERRMQKLELIRKELPIPKIIGAENANLTVVSWGSNNGAIIEAIEKINKEMNESNQVKVNFLPIKFMCPFHEKEIKLILEKCKNLMLVEANYSGQLGSLIREKTGTDIVDKFLRYDGTVFTVNDIYNKLKEILTKKGL